MNKKTLRQNRKTNSITALIQKDLKIHQDLKFKDFQSKLIPNVDSKTIIGVRTPILRTLAKTYALNPEISSFLNNLPHKYYDENQLHMFIISHIKDYNECICQIEKFMPYIDNWSTCDQLRPNCFSKKNNLNFLIKDIKRWLNGDFQGKKKDNLYVVRFAIEMLMTFYLDDLFKSEYLEWVSKIRSEEYYLNMMIAWFFATALAKQYEATLPYLKKVKLNPWTHNKSIQKALESNRITLEQKQFLRGLKVKC